MTHNSPVVFGADKNGDPCGIFARLGQGLYYLALGTWFGAMVMLAIGAAAAFIATRGLAPTLTQAPWNQPGLVEQSSTILAGAIVGKSLQGLAIVQIVCACVAVCGLLTQCTLYRNYLQGGVTSLANITRIVLVAIPVAVLLLDMLWITPQLYHWRDRMWDLNHPVEVRLDARQHFDSYHHLSERVVGFSALSLIGAVLASSLVLRITPDPSYKGSLQKPHEPEPKPDPQ